MQLELILVSLAASLIHVLMGWKDDSKTTRFYARDFVVSLLTGLLIQHLPYPIVQENAILCTVVGSFCAGSIHNLIITHFPKLLKDKLNDKAK